MGEFLTLSPIVGLLQIDIRIPGAASLKDKRRHLKSFRDGIHAKFNVSVAEVGDADLWKRIHLAVSMVSNEETFIRETFSKIVSLIARDSEVEILEEQVEML